MILKNYYAKDSEKKVEYTMENKYRISSRYIMIDESGEGGLTKTVFKKIV
jgi:Ca2+-binding EF-hand superfamily protein